MSFQCNVLKRLSRHASSAVLALMMHSLAWCVMCCVNFAQVASETWPSYIFLHGRHHQKSFFLFCAGKCAIFGIAFSVWCLPVFLCGCVGLSQFSARESKLTTLNWPEVRVQMVVFVFVYGPETNCGLIHRVTTPSHNDSCDELQ